MSTMCMFICPPGMDLSSPASVPVPTDPCSLEDKDDVKLAGQDDPTNVLSVTGHVNGLAMAKH